MVRPLRCVRGRCRAQRRGRAGHARTPTAPPHLNTLARLHRRHRTSFFSRPHRPPHLRPRPPYPLPLPLSSLCTPPPPPLLLSSHPPPPSPSPPPLPPPPSPPHSPPLASPLPSPTLLSLSLLRLLAPWSSLGPLLPSSRVVQSAAAVDCTTRWAAATPSVALTLPATTAASETRTASATSWR